jgi:multisubunit Na+/H+ antiporter MnhB subunit
MKAIIATILILLAVAFAVALFKAPDVGGSFFLPVSLILC